MQLSKLKKLSDDELWRQWVDERFPFDYLKDCNTGGGGRLCLTMHRTASLGRNCTNPTHFHLRRQLDNFGEMEGMPQFLRKNLEELFALRLFYANLYANPVPADALPVLEHA